MNGKERYKIGQLEEAHDKDVFKLYLSYDNVLADYAHFHPRFELVQVLEGEIEAVINGKTYCCKENDLIIVNPFEVHYYVRKTRQVNSIVLAVDDVYMQDFYRYYGKKQMDYATKNVAVSAELKANVRELLLPWEKIGVHNVLLNFSKFNYLLSLLLQEYPLVTPTALRLDIRRALDYIREHYNEPISMKSVAEKMGYSQEYFSGEFNKFVGMNFRSYLNKLRLEKARILLTIGNKNVTEVVEEVGFPNTVMYYRALKKYKHLLEE